MPNILASTHDSDGGKAWSYSRMATRSDECIPDDGRAWDLSKPEKQAKAMKKLQDDEPMMVVVSPHVRAFQHAPDVVQLP